MSRKSDLSFLPEFFDRYIAEVPQGELNEALQQNLSSFTSMDREWLNRHGDFAYASGKWTVKELLRHIIDNEIIQAYRALRFSRGDNTELPGYDEDLFVSASKASASSVNDLCEEFILHRRANILLFASFDAGMLQQTGTCFGKKVSVLSLGFVLAGHAHHHLQVLHSRYGLPPVG
jgi:hypothetical protein